MRPHLLLLLSLPAALLACSSPCPEGDASCDGTGLAEGGGGDEAGGDEGGGEEGGGEEGGDDGEEVIPVEFSDITAELTEVVTVVRVSWTTDVETSSWVEFGETEALGLRTNDSQGTSHEVLLLGNAADTELHFRVMAEDGSAEGSSSEDLTITTGSLPSGMPILDITGDYVPAWNYQVIPLQGTSSSVVIIDNQGRIVWYDVQSTEGNLMRSLIASDRKSVVLCHAGMQETLEEGRILWLPLDGSLETSIDLPYVDHDIVELPDGTIGAIRVEEGTLWDGRHGQADSIVEMNAEGEVTVIWNAWDEIDPQALPFVSDGNWTHSNGLDYVPEEDVYLISMKAIGTVAKVDRSTGATQWLINGQLNEFEFTEGSEIVEMQHQFEYLDSSHLLVFDNGTPERGYSRAVEFEIDQDELIAHQIWEYIRDPSLFVYAKGDVHRFEDGTTQVVWSSSGEIQLVNETNEVLWQANSQLGQAITFVQPFQSFYDNE